MPFSFAMEDSVYKGKDCVSVEIFLYVYTGGVHGNSVTKTFCFKPAEQKMTGIEEAAGRSLEEISAICRDALLARLKGIRGNYEPDDWFMNGTVAQRRKLQKILYKRRRNNSVF